VAYRVTVDFTYNNSSFANTARSNINTYLSSVGRVETAGGSGTAVFVQIDDLDEATAVLLRDGLTSRWAVGTRSLGRASVVRHTG
jgi:hypothetical protein